MNNRHLTLGVRVVIASLLACGCVTIGPAIAKIAAGRPSPLHVTAAWLRGTWGPNSNGSQVNEGCETENVVTFKGNGRYRDGAGYGMYRTDGKTITYYNRVLVDEADYSEDRSQFHVPLTTRVRAVNAYTLTEDGSRLYRCREG